MKTLAAATAAVLALALAPACAFAAPAPAPTTAALSKVCVSALPEQARELRALIEKYKDTPYSQLPKQKGGKGEGFPYERDGIVFQNREKQLPAQKTGYYHEFTVITPGLSHRGARRIVTGEPRTQQQYYTADHYRTFATVDAGC